MGPHLHLDSAVSTEQRESNFRFWALAAAASAGPGEPDNIETSLDRRRRSPPSAAAKRAHEDRVVRDDDDESCTACQAFPSTVGHCRSKESKAQVQEPQQIKVSKEVAHINASEVQARQPQSAEKPEAGQTSSEGVQS